MFLNYFEIHISKIIFKKIIKYYFNIFLNKKYFKKQLHLFFQINSYVFAIPRIRNIRVLEKAKLISILLSHQILQYSYLSISFHIWSKIPSKLYILLKRASFSKKNNICN